MILATGKKIEDSLPDNIDTRKRYKIWFVRYLKFLEINRHNHNLMSLVKFFEELKTTYSPYTLWQTYGALNTVLQAGLGQDLNQYPRLKKLLSKWKRDAPEQTQATAFTNEEIEKILSLEGRTKDENVSLCFDKCVCVISVHGGLRCDEICSIDYSWFKHFEPEKDCTITVGVKTKTLGANKHSFVVPASRMVHVLNYYNLMPAHPREGRFFKKYDDKKGKFTRNMIGKNKMAEVSKRLAKRLGLRNPEDYTSHSFKRTGMTLLSEGGASERDLMDYGRHKNIRTSQVYIQKSTRKKN